MKLLRQKANHMTPSAKKIDYTKPIPLQNPAYLTWAGKENGKPLPPIIWYGNK